jgi:hypothetical protein
MENDKLKTWSISIDGVIVTADPNDDPAQWAHRIILETLMPPLIVKSEEINAVDNGKRNYRCGLCGRNGHAKSHCPKAVANG